MRHGHTGDMQLLPGDLHLHLFGGDGLDEPPRSTSERCSQPIITKKKVMT